MGREHCACEVHEACPAAAAPHVAPAKFLELATSPHALEHRIELRDVTGAADRNIVGRQRRP
jgi:hypothetical protein